MTISDVGKNVEQWKFSFIAGRSVKSYSYYKNLLQEA
jgi:hypothetical protein